MHLPSLRVTGPTLLLISFALVQPSALPTQAETPAPGALEEWVGRWDRRVRWHQPGSDQVFENSGAASHTWTLEGRYLRCEWSTGGPAEAVQFLSYDADQDRHHLVWLDTWTSEPTTASGGVDPETGALVLRGRDRLPGYDDEVDVAFVLSREDEDARIEMFVETESKRALVMEVELTPPSGG